MVAIACMVVAGAGVVPAGLAANSGGSSSNVRVTLEVRKSLSITRDGMVTANGRAIRVGHRCDDRVTYVALDD
jgi:hypothetical protein